MYVCARVSVCVCICVRACVSVFVCVCVSFSYFNVEACTVFPVANQTFHVLIHVGNDCKCDDVLAIQSCFYCIYFHFPSMPSSWLVSFVCIFSQLLCWCVPKRRGDGQ